MMKDCLLKTFAIFFTLMVCSTSVQTQAADHPAWKSSMWKLLRSLDDLMPDAVSESRWNDKNNQKRIDRNLRKLQSSAAEIKTLGNKIHGDVPDKDPTIAIIARMLADNTSAAQKAFVSGNSDWSRYIVGSLSSTCLECHTRYSSGPKFRGITSKNITKTLSPIELAKYFAATRQFDEAEELLENYLKTTDLTANVIDAEHAITFALLLNVRLNKDPIEAQKFISFLESLRLPKNLIPAVSSWKVSIEKWKKTGSSESNAKSLLKLGRQLASTARGNSSYIWDARVFVDRLRATALLHEALAKGLSSKDESVALHSLGLAYEGLNDFNFWSLDELYFEACVTTHPENSEATSCLSELKRVVSEGYTGSGGILVPEDEIERINKLQTIIDDAKNNRRKK